MPDLYIGLLIGFVSGAVQFYLLQKFVGTLSKGKISNKTVLFAITQFFFPFIVLVICGFFISESLLWVGIGMASALIICGIARFTGAFKKK